MREVINVAKACEVPTGPVNRCPCGEGPWPCATTRQAWAEAGLDPEAEARRQVGMRVVGSLVSRRIA
jgi:hypothetical protein